MHSWHKVHRAVLSEHGFVAPVSATREHCCACANWSACVFDTVSRPRLCPIGTATVSCIVLILRGRRHNCWRAFWANLPLAFHAFLPSKGCWQRERVLGSSLRGVSGLQEYDADSRGNRFPTFRENVQQISHKLIAQRHIPEVRNSHYWQ